MLKPKYIIILFFITGFTQLYLVYLDTVCVKLLVLISGKAKEAGGEGERGTGDGADGSGACDPVEALHRKKERIFRSAAGEERHAPLPPPPLPAPGRCFDVHVAMAANPWNFVVRYLLCLHSRLTSMRSLFLCFVNIFFNNLRQNT